MLLILSINSQNVLSVTPSTQASNIVITNITSTSATISWTSGNGSNRVVFVENPSSLAAAPSNNTTYTACTDWNTKGTRLGTSNYYCVYNGSGNSITLTNLTPSSSNISISNMHGIVVYKVTTRQNSVDVDLTGVTSGIYFVKVDVSGIATVYKVIKN